MAVALYCDVEFRKVRVHKKPGQADMWPCLPCNKCKIAAFAGEQTRGFTFETRSETGCSAAFRKKLRLPYYKAIHFNYEIPKLVNIRTGFASQSAV